MLIRDFEATDAPVLSTLYALAVREGAKGDYSPAQIEAWSARSPIAETYIQLAQSQKIQVALGNNGQILGYGGLEPNGHIYHLYCHPEHQRTGIGTAIYSSLEEIAKKSGIKHLFVEASEGSRPLFKRQGFELVCRNDFVLDGVPIHNYRMSKSLRQSMILNRRSGKRLCGNK